MKPAIAISMGDPGGVGPEVILKALLKADVREMLNPVIFGDIAVLQRVAEELNLSISLVPTAVPQPMPAAVANSIAVFEPVGQRTDYITGGVGAVNGLMSHAYIVAAAKAVLAGNFDAMTTAPISKEALFQAGFAVPGHTELLAEVSGGHAVRMMLVGGGLRVVLQTIHVALNQVPGLLTTQSVLESLQMIINFSTRAGLTNPRIAVCGLNPHAGESGHFGTEEIDMIAPAIKIAVSQGYRVTGPFPADTVFHRALQGEFDFVLAMYHDQGLIPVKTLDFHGGVNVTVGLPLIRTSPDHGTAFNLAGKGLADERSMVSALKYAANLAQGRLQASEAK